jgi:excisionase family DNA binding protein
MNVKEAAKALNVHPRTIYNMINSGRLVAEKFGRHEWEISNDQLHALLSRSLVHKQKAEDLTTAVYSLEEFKETFTANTLRTLVEQCVEVAKAYESGERYLAMKLSLNRLDERIARYKLAQNASEFMNLALQKANFHTDVAFKEIETQINLLEVQ